MGNGEIFEAFSDEKQRGSDSKSVWSKKIAFFQYRFCHESGEKPRYYECGGTRDIGSSSEAEIEKMAEILSRVRVPSSSNPIPYTLQDYGIRRPEVDEYRHLLSSEITVNEIEWSELDSDSILPASIFDLLDQGILVVKNIPKIPLDKEYQPKDFYGFDTEDNGWGIPHFHQFAWRDGVAFSYSFRLLYRWANETFNLKAGNHIIWCTNLEYDFGNAIKDFEVNGEALDVRWRRGKLAKAILKHDVKKSGWGVDNGEKYSWEMWDTMNHWPFGVAKQGAILSEMMGYDFTKLPQDFFGLKYAAMDAIISRSYASVQASGYQTRGIPFKLTPGAVSMAWYMNGTTAEGERFCKQRVYRTHADDELDWLYPALKGGRTEVFSLKAYEIEKDKNGEYLLDKKDNGKIGYFDINSAYPFSMLYEYFPKLNPHFWREGHKNIAYCIDENYEGVVDCEVDTENVENFVKIIPYLGLTDEKTKRFIFPLGKWRSKYTFFEIRKAMSYGYKFKFIKALVYERAKIQPFKDYVKTAYALRIEGAATGNQVLRDVGKSLGNNLFGKWGQRSTFTQVVNPADYDAEEIKGCAPLGDSVLLEINEGYSIQTNVIWGAYITAITRDLLYSHIIEAMINGNEILYCDTDSIFITGGKWPKSHPTELGALKHEDNLSYFKALLPKCYMYKGLNDTKIVYKVKGVPDGANKDQKEKFFTSGRVEYRKPIKIRENQRRKTYNDKEAIKRGIKPRGVHAINAWVTVTKELKGKYTKRIVHKDGSTSPLILKME